MRGRAWSDREIAILREVSSTRGLTEIAEGLGRTYNSVWRKAVALNLITKKRGNREVAVYRNDDLLAVGTLKECAEITGLSYQTLMCYLSPSFKHKKTNVTVVLLEDEDEEENA